MKDHLVVVEGPLNDERALAVIAEARSLAPGKPIRYVVDSHHHFDHSGRPARLRRRGRHRHHPRDQPRLLRADAGGAGHGASPTTLASRAASRWSRACATTACSPTATRTIEIHHIAGNAHADGLLMVYLPKEKLLSEADVFTPPPAEHAAASRPARSP